MSEKLQSDLIFYIEKFQDLIKKLIFTLFEKYSKCLIWIVQFCYFHQICPIKIDLSDNTVLQQASDFQKSCQNGLFFGTFS